MAILNLFKKNVSNTNYYSFPVLRANRLRQPNEQTRVALACRNLDMYTGFGRKYIVKEMQALIKSPVLQTAAVASTICLPLVKTFIDGISRVYAVQPTRRFFYQEREIVDVLPDDVEDANKYYVDADLYKILKGFYSSNMCSQLQQAERFTNLLSTTLYKVVKDDKGVMQLSFVQNDAAYVIPFDYDCTIAEEITFVKNVPLQYLNLGRNQTSIETWTPDYWSVDRGDAKVNESAEQSLDLYGSKIIGSAFPPFVAFRSTSLPLDFWNIANDDVISSIITLNVMLSELKYLISYASFGLKYVVGVTPPKDGVLDPLGIIQFGLDPQRSSQNPPTGASDNNWEIGEFKNDSKIKEVTDAIILQLKILFSMFNLPIDSLLSGSSARSAESKKADNEQLFDSINAQREIWYDNEQNLFKTMCSVYNRDSEIKKIPKDVTLIISYDEHTTTERSTEDWLVLINQNVVSILDWVSELNPDLNRDELKRLLQKNIEENESYKEEEPDFTARDLGQQTGNAVVDPEEDEPDETENGDNEDD